MGISTQLGRRAPPPPPGNRLTTIPNGLGPPVVHQRWWPLEAALLLGMAGRDSERATGAAGTSPSLARKPMTTRCPIRHCPFQESSQHEFFLVGGPTGRTREFWSSLAETTAQKRLQECNQIIHCTCVQSATVLSRSIG